MKEQLIQKIYTEFNDRNIPQILQTMTPDVKWPKAFEGGHVIGQDEVGKYWTRQWCEINPQVFPVGFTELDNGTLRVDVHQIVKNLDGELIFDGNVQHIYTFEDGLISQMDLA